MEGEKKKEMKKKKIDKDEMKRKIREKNGNGIYARNQQNS